MRKLFLTGSLFASVLTVCGAEIQLAQGQQQNAWSSKAAR
jgi:hypothetical protein